MALNTDHQKPREEALGEMERQLRFTSFPDSVILDTANLCNYSCAGCARRTMTRARGKMPISLAKRVIDEVADVSPKTKLWLTFYGEPTIIIERVVFLSIYAARKGVTNIFLNTNASLLRDDAVEMLLESGIAKVILSLDALTDETYAKVRKPGMRETVYQNAYRLVQRVRDTGAPLQVVAQIVRGPLNGHEVEQFKAHWKELGVQVKVKDYINWTRPTGTDSPFPAWRIACPWAFSTFVVLHDGRVPVCGADYDGRHILGDMNKDSINSIWNGESLRLRRLHLNHQFGSLPQVCVTCGDWDVLRSEST